MTRHCAYCGATIIRYRGDFRALKNAFCNRDHYHRYQRGERIR
jgi:hypothetical protein